MTNYGTYFRRSIIFILWIFFIKDSISREVQWTFNTTVPTSSGFECSASEVQHLTIEGPSQDKFNCFIGQIRSDNCTRFCYENTTYACNGDNDFCSSRNCDINAECYCRKVEPVSVIKSKCGANELIIDGWLTKEETVVFYLVDDEETSNIAESFVSEDEREFSMKFIMTGKQLTVINQTHNGEEDLIVVENSNSLNEIKFNKKKTKNIRIYNNKGSMIYFNTISPNTYDGVDRADLCNHYYCDYCDDNYSYTNCQIGNFGYLKFWTIFVIVILCLVLLPWICLCLSLPVRLIACMCSGCKKLRKQSKKSKMNKRVKDKNGDTLFEEEEMLESETTTESNMIELEEEEYKDIKKDIESPKPETRDRRNYKVVFKNGKAEVVFLTFVCFVGLCCGQAQYNGVLPNCDTVNLLVTPVYSCTRFNSTHETCQMAPAGQVTLPGPGSTACINYRNEGNTSFIRTFITFTSFEVSTPLIKEYYTSAWDGVNWSQFVCFSGPIKDTCNNYDRTCANYNPSNDLNPCGYFNNFEGRNLPGISGCYGSCGCATCAGCFYCEPSNVYWRAAIKPKGQVGQVMSTGPYIYTANLRLIVCTTVCSVYSITSNNPFISQNWFRMNLNGVFIDFVPNFGTKRILVDTNGQYLVDAALTNQPKADVIGDIQADSTDRLTNPGLNTFKYSSELIRTTQGAYSMGVSYKSSGYGYKENFPKFPTSFNGLTWGFYSNNLKASISRTNSAVVSFQAISNITVYSQYSKVCPQVTFINGTGCYNCQRASYMIVKTKSTCLAGLCSIYTTNGELATTVIYIDVTEQTQNITIFGNTADFKAQIAINCGGEIATFNANMKLVDESTIYDNKNDTFNNDGAENPAWDGSFFNLDTPLGQGLTSAFIIILLIIVLIIVFAVLFCCCKRYKEKKNPGQEYTRKEFLKNVFIDPTVKAKLNLKKAKEEVNKQEYESLMDKVSEKTATNSDK